MFVSITGLLGRMKGRKDYIFGINEFLKHYKQAKKAHREGNKEFVDSFFNTYVTDEDR